MSILDELEKLEHRKLCQKQKHEWEYETSHGCLSIYICKYCSSILTESEDTGHGG